MSLYVLIDIVVVAGPLALSFDRRVGYVRRWPAALAASLLVGACFAAWDSLMVGAGAWGFSGRFAGEARIFSLPPGELLFFFVVPFSCIFVREVIGAYVPDRGSRGARVPGLIAAVLLASAAVPLRSHLYTSTVLLAAALFLAAASVFSPRTLGSRVFWLSMAATYVPFLAVNGVLTWLPVVTYSGQAILGPRLATIPVEDFLYSFSLLGFSFLTHGFLREPLRVRPWIRRQRGTP